MLILLIFVKKNRGQNISLKYYIFLVFGLWLRCPTYLPAQNGRDITTLNESNEAPQSHKTHLLYLLTRYPQKEATPKTRAPNSSRLNYFLSSHSHSSNTQREKDMAAESVRLTTGSPSSSSLTNFTFNGSQRRPSGLLSPFGYLGLLHRPRPSSSLTSSSVSQFFGNVRLSSKALKLSGSSQQSRRNLSVFAMAADGLFLVPFLSLFRYSLVDSFLVQF